LRYFSSAGYIVNKTRSLLDSNTVNTEQWTCSCVCRIGAALLLTLKFRFSIHINNFELTGDPFKLVKLYNLCHLL